MSDTPDLSPRQEELLGYLPASSSELADQMGVKQTTVENYRNAIREKGVDLQYDRDANQWFLADERSGHLRSLSTDTKQSVTKEASALIEDAHATLFRKLRGTEPLQAPPQPANHSETFGAILGDLHFGDLVEKEFWSDDEGEYITQEVYNSDIAREAVETFAAKVIYFRDLMQSVTEFDDCYLFLLGDIATGTEIYENQDADIELCLQQQVEQSVTALYNLIELLADEFETVQVRAVPGNHGTAKPSAAIGANTDLECYFATDFALRKAGVDNVDFRYSQTHEYLNTTVRDWRFHVRHGHSEKEHVDETASSARDWRGLVDEFTFDVAIKGHHHSPAFHKVMNKYPVFSSPSPKPGGEFPSRIGQPDTSRHADLGWVFGVSDKRPVTWHFLVDDR